MKVNALGIDPGLAVCGLVVIEYDTEVSMFSLKAKEMFLSNTSDTLGKRLLNLADTITSLSKTYSPQFACCEGVSVNSTNKPYSLGAAHGIICATVELLEVPFYKASPLELKKFASGIASASKETVRQNLVKDFALQFDTLDEFDISDAATLAIIALAKGMNIKFKSRAKMEVLLKLPKYHNIDSSRSKDGGNDQ
jgi:Holliday junction resolvasome RuvABC endonuclease subunit